MPNPHPRYLKPVEIPKGVIIDLDSQRLVRNAKGKAHLEVDYICRKCGARKAYIVAVLRYKIKNKQILGYCMHCFPRHKPKTKGGIRVTSGYRWLHMDLIEPEILKMFADAGMNINRRNQYIQEHRVVAVRKFGRMATWPDVLIRHKDGNRLNNSPSNLLIGTDQDNKDDHMTSIRKMMEWRMTALFLWELLRFNLHNRPAP